MVSRPALAPSTALLESGSRFAALAAALCGLHCALTPLVVVLLPTLALSENVERALLVGTAGIGALILLAGPARNRPAILATFTVGACVWAASLAGFLEPVPENLTSAAGSLILAAALIAGARICRSGDCEVCESDRVGEPAP